MKPCFLICVYLFCLAQALDFDEFFNKAFEDIKKQVNAETKAANRRRLRDPVMAKLFSFLQSTPYIKKTGNNALEQLAVIKHYQLKSRLSGPALWKNLSEIFPGGEMFKFCFKDKLFSDQNLPFPEHFNCCPLTEVKCKADDKYRTIDGSCNCLTNPNMGRSNRAYARFLPPQYADGIGEPRAAKNGSPLPSARKVSDVVLEPTPSIFSGVITQLHMTFGQMVDHDSDRTPISKFLKSDGTLEDVECGSDGCQTTGLENKECFPMPVPKDDSFFKKKCLMFVRSQAFVKDKCKIGPREQPNVLTSWLDVSFLYGSTIQELKPIRKYSKNRGQMKTIRNPVAPHCKPLIPTRDLKTCRDVDNKIKCFLAGDARENEQVGVQAIHVTYVRLHNYVEEQLHRVNPHWDGEKLFQESRRIVVAVHQNIVYREYLPLVLGPKVMKEFGLNLSNKKCTKPDCVNFDADVTNSFATAAFRFGHSQVTDKMRFASADFKDIKDVAYSSLFFRPRAVYETHFNNKTCGVDAILLGHAAQRTDSTDRFFTKQVTAHMFTDFPPHGSGTDLPATSTQRGRDHGIPGYTAFRKFCGLSVATSFKDMKDIPSDVRLKFQKLYDHVDDVDLFPAAMTEELLPNAAVGPTFACMLAKQFESLKKADRFWFENCGGKQKFSKDQLKNIRQYTFGRFYCDTLDEVLTIQPFPMMVSANEAMKNLRVKKKELLKRIPLYKQSSNERVPCSQLPAINFDLWKS